MRARHVGLFGIALVISIAGCPKVSILSVGLDDVRRDRATLHIQLQVDNPEVTQEVDSSIALGLESSWSVEEVRYQVPGEPLVRRARPSPGLAANADWTFDDEGLAWWGFDSAEHMMPAGTTVYDVEVDVRYPRRTRSGSLALVVGDPSPDSPNGRYALTLRPGSTVEALGALPVNPENQVESSGDAADGFQQAVSALSNETEMMGALAEETSELRELGTLIGVNTGARGFREPWIQESTRDGVIQLTRISVQVPDDWSVLGDPPTGPETALVFMPPGSPCVLGLEIVPDLDQAMADEAFAREVETARKDLSASGVAATVHDDALTTPGGLRVVGKELGYVDEFGPGRLLLLRRYEAETLVLAVTFGDPDTMALAVPHLLQLLDTVGFE